MKKLTSVLLVISMLLICSCANSQPQSPPQGNSDMNNEFAVLYKGASLTSFFEVASLYEMQKNNKDLRVENCDYSALVKEPDREVRPMSEYLLSLYFLDKAGIDTENLETKRYLDLISEKLSECDSLDTEALSLAVMALEKYEREYDCTEIAKSLRRRQNKVTFGFYVYPQTGSEKAVMSVDAAAYALTAYMMIRNKLTDKTFEDDIHDGTLTYLGNQIDDNNLIFDSENRESSYSTALVLSSLIAAGIPIDGEISTALLNAVSDFKIAVGETLHGYTRYRNGELDIQSTIQVLFAVCCSMYGNPITK